MSRNETVNVSLRFRPLNTSELEENESNIWNITKNTVSLKSDWNQYLIDCKKLSSSARSYTYNYCFTSNDSNSLIYSTVAKPLIHASLEGYNGTIFAYGQTGSGKTYTMMGSESSQEPPAPRKREMRSVSPAPARKLFPTQPVIKFELPKEKGIIILALQDLFAAIHQSFERTYYLTCSYLEIYNEQVYDLLGENLHIKTEVLTVNEDADGFYVNELSEHTVNNIEEVLEWIKKGESNRKYAATAMNHHSSRSHTIFRINVTSIRMIPDSDDGSVTTESVLNFVDLAGSERVSNLIDPSEPKHRNAQKTESLLNEGKHINTSLFYLCQVINKLSEKGISKADVHVPYRNSNLTKILSSSLGGNSLTSIICTATPILSQFEMTLSTLRFGGAAKTITNTVEANVKSNKNSELLKGYQKDLDALRKELEEAQQGGKEIAESNLMIKKQLEDRISRLNSMLVQEHSKEEDKKEDDEGANEVFKSPAGYLRVDKRLLRPNEVQRLFNEFSEFEDKGAVVFERLKAMSIELRSKNKEILNLTEQKGLLQDSKVNVRNIQLKNELKKALELCKSESDIKKQAKEKYKALRAQNKILMEKLSMLELESVQTLDLVKLKQLENFYYKALDKTKDMKFLQKINLKAKDSPRSNTADSLWKQLEISDPPFLSDSGSEDSELEFESSFYKSRRINELSAEIVE